MSDSLDKYCKYSIYPSVIPQQLLLPVSIEELLKANVTHYNFELETNLLPIYNEYYLSALQKKEKKELELKKSNDTNNSVEIARDQIVKDMMNQSGQDRDVCYFYLESVDWDLEKALDLYKSSY